MSARTRAAAVLVKACAVTCINPYQMSFPADAVSGNGGRVGKELWRKKQETDPELNSKAQTLS